LLGCKWCVTVNSKVDQAKASRYGMTEALVSIHPLELETLQEKAHKYDEICARNAASRRRYYRSKLETDPEYLAKVTAQNRDRYWADTEFRERCKAAARERNKLRKQPAPPTASEA